MSSRASLWLGAFGLALVISVAGGSAGRTADEDEDEIKATKEAQVAVVQMVEAMRKGDSCKEQAEAIHKKFPDLKPVMNIFKPSSKHGLGVGPKGPGDGIEQRIINWSTKTQSRSDAARNRPAMERAAEVSRAMAEVADVYLPKKDVSKWKKYCQEMRDGADELMKSARGGDPKAIKTAATNLNGSCTSCHGDFRD
jgi:cytochrome c556